MANLKTFSGFPIQNLSSDPVPYAQALADNPYAGVWSSGGAMNTARSQLSGAGTQTAALAMSGEAPGGNSTNVENYNGSSWTEITDVNTGRRNNSGFGTSTAAILAGGYGPSFYNNTEYWNGS